MRHYKLSVSGLDCWSRLVAVTSAFVAIQLTLWTNYLVRGKSQLIRALFAPLCQKAVLLQCSRLDIKLRPLKRLVLICWFWLKWLISKRSGTCFQEWVKPNGGSLIKLIVLVRENPGQEQIRLHSDMTVRDTRRQLLGGSRSWFFVHDGYWRRCHGSLTCSNTLINCFYFAILRDPF